MRRIFLTLLLALAFFGLGIAVAWRHFHGTTSTTQSVGTTNAASTKITVPVLREKFTLLSCDANTTIGMEGCAERQIISLDTRINTLRGEIFSRLYNRSAKSDFVIAENSWYSYRQATCLSDANLYQGGSLAPVEAARCDVRVNQQHVSDLSALRKSY